MPATTASTCSTCASATTLRRASTGSWAASNTFTVRYGFWNEAEHGDLSAGSLPTASTHESNTDHTVQMSDAFVINDHAVNESRFQYERQNENHYPDSTAPTITVQGDFTDGGYTGQESRDHATRLEFQNLTTISHGAHAIKFGTRLRDSRDANFTTNNYNGIIQLSTATPTTSRMANGLAGGRVVQQPGRAGLRAHRPPASPRARNRRSPTSSTPPSSRRTTGR